MRAMIIVGLTIASAMYIFPLDKKINLGLDLRGGMYVLLRADLSSVAKDPKQQAKAIEGAVEKIRNRVDSYGVKETSIQTQGDNSILVQVPGVVDRDIINGLKEMGKLEFNLVSEDQDALAEAFKGNLAQGYVLRPYEASSLLVQQEASINGSDLQESTIGFDQYGIPEVRLQFTPDGGKKFAKVTQDNVGKRLAITLDNKIMSAPVINGPIPSGQAQITGQFSMDEVRMLTSVLNSGALPIPLIVEEERTVGPLLGSDSIKRGIDSMVWGTTLVVLFMLAYYTVGGLAAVVCLILDVLFILAGLYMFRGSLSLPGIAGMVLTLGMAVDSNVLIYERIREELRAGKPLSVATKIGFDRAKATIYDANYTTLIAGLFLFIFGTGPIRGFATTLCLGLIVSMFTAIYVGRTIFAFMLERGLKKFPMLQFFPDSKIDFVKFLKPAMILSLIVMAAGIWHFNSRKDAAYGIDFRGGQVLEYKISPVPSIEDVRKTLDADHELPKLTIQDRKDIPGAIIIYSRDDVADKVEKALKAKYTTVDNLNVTTVGPTVGDQLRQKALWAIVMSLLGIMVYVFIRFHHFDFAISGVIAIFHDIIITVAFASFAGYEMSLLLVTALLTIAGYSINDTIVVYDRIREIAPRMHKSSISEIINTALNNTFSRTVITALTVIFVVLAMYFVGGEALQGFSYALLVGFISGMYSTMFIALPLVIMFRRKYL